MLRHYWERLFPRLRRAPATGTPVAVGRDSGASELAMLQTDQRVLATQVEQLLAQLDQLRDREAHTSADQEDIRRTQAQALAEATRKLVDLESANAQLSAMVETASGRIAELGGRLAELEDGREQAHDQIQGLGQALTEAASRLERADSQIKDLQVRSVEQGREFEASLATADSRLEDMDSKVKILGIKMDNERQQVMHAYRETQDRLRKQYYRMNWAFAFAGLALLLGVFAGAAQVWNVQKNAALLAGMSRDINSLLLHMDNVSGTGQGPQEESRQALPAASVAGEEPLPAVPAAKHGSGLAVPGDADSDTGSQADATPAVSGNTYGQIAGRERSAKPQFNRQDARRFFADNAAYGDVFSTPSGAQYRVVKSGSGKSPTLSDKVVISYVGITPEGKVIDETYSEGTPTTFSMKDVTPAWRDALLEMQVGAEFEVYVPAELAQNKGVRKRRMGDFEPRIYLIELLQVESGAAGDAALPGN